MAEKPPKDISISSFNSNPPPKYEFFDPSKESIWTRLGLTFESFKRAPGVTRYVVNLKS